MYLINDRNIIIFVLIIITSIVMGMIILLERKSFPYEMISKNISAVLGNFTEKSPQFTRIISTALLVSILLLTSLLLLRPSLGYDDYNSSTSNVDVIFAIDTSLSMGVRDIDGENRLKASQRIVEEYLSKNPSVSAGLISFTHKGFIESPITSDLQTVIVGTQTLKVIDSYYGRGSSIEAALTSINDLLDYGQDQSEGELKSQRTKVVVIISDGEVVGKQQGNISEQINALTKAGVKVFTIGVGSESGGQIPSSYGPDEKTIIGYAYNNDGSKAISKLESELLMKIAKDGQGEYYEQDEINKLTEDIQNISKTVPISEELKFHKETYYIFAILLIPTVLIFHYRPYQLIKMKYKK